MENFDFTPMITEKQIKDKVQEMGKALTKECSDKKPLALCVLKGSFMFYVAQKEREVSFFRGEEEKHFRLESSNRLLGRNNIDGVKTGLTRAAGPCLALAQPDLAPDPGSSDRVLIRRTSRSHNLISAQSFEFSDGVAFVASCGPDT